MNLEAVYRKSPIWLQTLLLNAYAQQRQMHRFGKQFRDALAGFLESERWPHERIVEYQSELLQRVVKHAHEHSPYYRRAFAEWGVEPQDIRHPSDLGKLPVLTKEDVRDYEHDLMTRPSPGRGWIEGHTSGTTGSPLGIWYDREVCAVNNAADWRQKTWAGMREGDWIGVLLGRVIVPMQQKRPPYWRANRVQRQVWFSSFHLSPDNLRGYVSEIERRRLRFLEGYPSTLYILAKHLLERGRTLPMKAVLTSSETLHETQREAIEAAFECKLFDFYGLAERVIFAGECEVHEGKHVAEEFGILEVVDENGAPVEDGQPGYLVGTSLHNGAMPMIRYRTSDVSRIRREPCRCGRTLSRIDAVTTKAEDIIVTPDGRMISPSVLTHPFKPLKSVAKSQIVQEDVDQIVVKLVPKVADGGAGNADDGSLESERQQLLRGLRERVGAGLQIEIQQVEDIPREPSGKYRWVISKVAHSCIVPWEAESS